MQHLLSTSLILTVFATASFAADPVTLGEKTFKKCTACHAIIDDSGAVLRKGGKAGPNLYRVIGRAAASTEFRYSKALKAAGTAGVVWDEVELATFVENPSAYLKVKSGNKKARSKMSYKLKKGGSDVAAYLQSIAK